MSNQYKTALQDAAGELAKDIAYWGIVILPYEIRWKNQALEVLPYTDRRKCKREIKKMIALAEEEKQLSLKALQGNLL